MLGTSLRSNRGLLLAGTSLLFFASSAAFAQDTTQPTDEQPVDQQQPVDSTQPEDSTQPGDVNAQPPADDGTIVVTGIRRSLQNSIQIKRDSASVVEVVSAEEIGKLPDVSIAESIARLPGIAAQRVKGRAEIVSIRGFSPDFTTVLLNGRQQASSGFNRAVEFDQYPSELMASVVVYKTPDASIAGMGLAGTVDLRTIRPLEYGKRAFAVNLRGQLDQGGGRNEDFSKYGWRGSVSYIDQNADGTLGWMMSYAHLDAPSHVNETKNWFYADAGGGGQSELSGIQMLAGEEIRASNSRDIRDGVTGTVEWKPSDAVHSVLDLYYSRFKQETTTRGVEFASTPWSGDPTTYSSVAARPIDGVLFESASHVDNIVPVLRWADNHRTDHLFSAGLNNEFRLAENTQLIADLSYSSNKRDETDTEIFGGYGVGPLLTRVLDSYDRAIPADDFLQSTNFGLDYADANQVSLGDRGGWGGYGSEGHIKSPRIKETLASGDLTLRQDLEGTGIGNFFSNVEAGLDYTHRHKDKRVDELDLFLKNDRMQVLVDSQFLTDPTSLGYAGDLSILGVQVTDLVKNGNYYDIVQLEDSNHFDKAWDIKEDILTWKAKATIDSGDLHGNVGIQVVQQKQKSSGLRINFGVSPIELVNVEESAKYTDVLPSLNLFYDLNQHHRIRFAAAKVMARPRMDDMRANLTPNFSGGVCEGRVPPQQPCGPGVVVNPWSANGGNPKLEPWRAKEVDIGYEWYGGKASYFAVHGWYMWLDNYIYTQVLPADFTGLTPSPTELATLQTACPECVISPIGSLTAPANGQGGWLRGIEVSGAFEFGRLAPVLDGFGATGSISYTDYKLDQEALDQIPNRVLPGFSKWVYDLTGYYEKNGFQARAAWRHRSKYQGEVIALFANLQPTLTQPDEQVDAQVGYTFQPGSRMEGLGILLQVSNVLNSPYRTYVPTGPTGTIPMLERVEKYGRSWMLGASYHF
ncbi:MAG TPA: TonB-dependent receptor [Sphingomicrobium sp.]|nr:TonB-dependent receptor [Sphingomicrobium sp.]